MIGRCPTCGNEITTGHACSREIAKTTAVPADWSKVSGIVVVKPCHHSGALSCATCSAETIAALRAERDGFEDEADKWRRLAQQLAEALLGERKALRAGRPRRCYDCERPYCYVCRTGHALAAARTAGVLK